MININLGGKFAGIWKKTAAAKIQQMETAREFWGLIAGFVFLRIITSLVSIFSGYSFFRVNFAGVIENPTARIFCAVGLLAVIEVITAAFLFKMFKFVFAYRWGAAVSMFVGACLFYSISFYTSTNGIALYKSDTTEQAATLNEQAAATSDSVRTYYASQIAIIRANIDAITPPRWNTDSEGKPQLTTTQQNTKTALYNKILSLQAEQREALKQADADAESQRQTITAAANVDADKYAGYVCVIMILQLIANGVLCFLYSRIYHENNRTDEITADIKNFATGIAADTDAIIKTQITEQYGQYLTSMQRNLIAMRGAGNNTNIIQPSIEVAPVDVPNIAASAAEPSDPEPSGEPTPAEPEHHAQKVVIRGFAADAETNEPKDESRRTPTNAASSHARITRPVYTNPVYIRTKTDSNKTDGNKTNKTDTNKTDTKTNNKTDNKTDGQTDSNKTNGKTVYVGDGWRYCELCGKPYQPRHVRQKYCCEPCKFQACANKHNRVYKFYGVEYYPQK